MSAIPLDVLAAIRRTLSLSLPHGDRAKVVILQPEQLTALKTLVEAEEARIREDARCAAR